MTNDERYNMVQKNIDALVDKGVQWSIPVTHDEIMQFISGDWSSFKFFFPRKKWIPEDVGKKKILCLAGAGGQQAPLFAATGAEVTVFDLSGNMLSQDKMVSVRENLPLRIEQGNMNDLSVFEENYFDIVINPPSLMYLPEVMPVFNECYRVLKKGGMFIMSAPNPLNYICEFDESTGSYIACNKLPYKSYDHDNQGDWIEYGHTLESYIGGQIEAGFMITGFYENNHESSFESDFTTMAIKM